MDDWDTELIKTYVPDAEKLDLTFEAALALAMERDRIAAEQAIMDKEETSG